MVVIYNTPDGRAYSTPEGLLLAFYSNPFITDRTYQDVLRWKTLHDKGWEAMSAEEQEEWVGGMKGAYNYTDMNRVETAVEQLQARFLQNGTVLSLTTKTDWTRTGWPTKSDMARYFGNVAAIRRAVVSPDLPAAPTTAALFNYEKANDIEKILLGANNWLDRIEASQMYSGDLYLGEV